MCAKNVHVFKTEIFEFCFLLYVELLSPLPLVLFPAHRILFFEWSSSTCCWNILLMQTPSIKVVSSYWQAVQNCLRNKSFLSINFITMSSVPSFCCWKSNLNSFSLCLKYFFFHLLMFNLCKNAILIQQKCYFTRNISLYPNQEGPHGKVYFQLSKHTRNKRWRERRGNSAQS